jgi:hypothetical protein
MVRLFLIIFATLYCSLAWANEDKKAPKSFEDIAAELNAKKQELEPFDRKKVKVDLESLGLDDVDNSNKDDAKKVANTTEEKPKEELKVENLEVIKPAENKPLGDKTVIIENSKQDLAAPVIANQSSSPALEAKGKNKAVDKKTIVKKPVKKPLKKQDIVKIPQTQNEKIQIEKSQELSELRKKYLAKFSNKKSDLSSQEQSDIVVPRRKEIGKFIVDETPPEPILNRFRSSENIHIPTVSTKPEMIEVLFDVASLDNISLFSDAYKDIENPNVKNKNGDTILTFATLLKKYSIMASLLEKGADPNMPNKLGYSPLAIAIEMLDSKSCEILFNGGADINYVDALGRTYLMQAVKVGFLPGVELLVRNGVDVNAMDNEGFTALAVAYRYKRDVIVKYLLKNNARTWSEKPSEVESQSMIKDLENRWK